MANLDLYNKLKEVPEVAKKEIAAGRLKGMTDINPVWRIKVMTETFGPCGIGWYYEIVNQWQETYGSEIKAFTNINLYIKVDGEWSKPIVGTGGASLVAMEKNGAYVSDEGFKMSLTDALSVAMKSLGVAADVYFAKGASYDTKYESRNATPAQTNTLKQGSTLTESEKEDLFLAIDEIKQCKTIDELNNVAEKWKGFYKVAEFVKAGQIKKQELINTGK